MLWFSGLILDMNRAWPEWGHTWIGTVGHESGWHGKGQTWISPLKYVKYITDMNGVRHEKVRTWIGPFGHEWGQTWIGPDMNRSDMNRWTWIGSTWIGRAWMGIIPNYLKLLSRWLRVFFICDVIQLSDKEGNVYHKKPTAVKWIGCIWLYNLFTSYEFMAMGVCAMNMCTLLLLFLVIRIIEWFKSFFLVDSGQ